MEATTTRSLEQQQQPDDVVSSQETSIQIIFREIHKNAWLRRLVPTGERKANGGAYSKRGENVWVVFCVHDDRDPYLEVYGDQKVAAAHRPDWCAPLSSCMHVTPTICASQDGHHEFVITLRTGIVKLAAPTWELMMEWVGTLRSKLEEMKILTPPENIYSQPPQLPRGPLLPTRDPNSPLPPTPAGPRSLSKILPMISFMGSSLQEATSHYERLYLGESTSTSEPPVSPEVQSNASVPTPRQEVTSTQTQTDAPRVVRSQEQMRVPRRRGPRLVPIPIARALQPVPHPFRPPLPPPQTMLTLREQQVLQLSREMRHPGGVRLQLRRKDCSGLLSVAGVPVPSAAEAHRIIRATSCLYVELVVRRVPFGRVLAIRRELEGQDLGLELEAGTAEIRNVHPLSPAARAGLPPRAPTCDGLSLSNWVLTEVNSRPLNLFFKEGEVRDRLNAVGIDISILVQPFDLVRQIKKQLKSIRGHKDYLVQ
ncbi:hypothetical protein B566_EDAN005121 [Ephemera danica]|nr:hypothetical protein B566_EDAN005121 [Ephemera danica]